MADGYDRYDNEGSGGGSFVMGLLTGTVLGAGLGMLFAPKAGAELRGQLSEQAGTLKNQASEGYRRASEAATDWAGRGREVVDKARDAVSRGAEEAQRYVKETAANAGTPSPAMAGGASSTESMRGRESGSPAFGSGSEQTRGSQSNANPGGSTGSGPGTPGTPGTPGGTRRS